MARIARACGWAVQARSREERIGPAVSAKISWLGMPSLLLPCWSVMLSSLLRLLLLRGGGVDPRLTATKLRVQDHSTTVWHLFVSRRRHHNDVSAFMSALTRVHSGIFNGLSTSQSPVRRMSGSTPTNSLSRARQAKAEAARWWRLPRPRCPFQRPAIQRHVCLATLINTSTASVLPRCSESSFSLLTYPFTTIHQT